MMPGLASEELNALRLERDALVELNQRLLARLEALVFGGRSRAGDVQVGPAENGVFPTDVLDLVMLIGSGVPVFIAEDFTDLGVVGYARLLTAIAGPFIESVYEAAEARGLEPVEWMGQWRRRHEAGGDTP